MAEDLKVYGTAMFKIIRAMLLACLLPGVAFAAGPASEFTPAQRDEIVQIVREALKTDPSILRDAIATLQAQDEAKDAAEARATIAARQKDLVNTFGDPEAGNPHGDVTLVEFYDPRCPYCRRMLAGIDALVQKDHGLRIVYKDIPVLGPASVLEARAIVAAQKQGGYLKMQAALMKDTAQPTMDGIRATATSLGLNANQLAADMNSTATTQRINNNLALARALKLQGTPAFVVGMQMIPGMVTEDQLEDAVSDARKHA
jgi:protein-disulfide isomerase